MYSTTLILSIAFILGLVSAGRGHQQQRSALVRRSARHTCHPSPSCSYSRSYSSPCSSTPSMSCSYGSTCSMSVSWEESEVRAEIVRQRVKNPRHRLYYRPHSSSSTSSTSCNECGKNPSCPTEYTTIEIIRPHVGHRHKRKVHVKEQVCSLSTEVEVIKKNKCESSSRCCKKGKPRYEVICKKPCQKKKPCEKRMKKPCGCKKPCNCAEKKEKPCQQKKKRPCQKRPKCPARGPNRR